MNYRKVLNGIFFLALACLFGARTLCAQDEPQEPSDTKPKPAARSTPVPFIVFADQDENGNRGGDLQPDYTPLTGMLNAGLGFPEIRHSYWVPGIQFSSMVESNLYNQSSTSSWHANNYAIGNLSLLEAWSRSQLAVNYSGGGSFSTNSAQGNGWYQQLAFAESFHLNRWLFQIFDQFSYLPQSAFGFGAGTNFGVPGVGGSLGPAIPGLGNNYNPNQTVFAGVGPRYSNAAVVQATYELSRRSSITASGSYGILNYVDPGNIDTNSVFGGLGYNYMVNHKDTIGLFYQFSSYHFPGNPQAYGSQTVGVAYSRKITGRLALSVSGGPQFTSLRIPVGTTSNTVSGYVSALLNYGLEKGAISASYIHGLSGGSGGLTGSILDQVNFTASRSISRVWSANANVGFAHNRTVVNSALSTSNPSYNNWFAGGGIARPLGRNVNLSIGFSANFGNSLGCSGPGCGTSSTATSQVVTVNVQWHTRPLVLP